MGGVGVVTREFGRWDHNNIRMGRGGHGMLLWRTNVMAGDYVTVRIVDRKLTFLHKGNVLQEIEGLPIGDVALAVSLVRGSQVSLLDLSDNHRTMNLLGLSDQPEA